MRPLSFRNKLVMARKVAMNFPQIETARLRLRPWRAEDVDDLHRLWTHPEVRRYLWDDLIITPEQAAEVISSSLACFEEHGFGQWVISPKAEAAVIGFCGFRFFGDPPEVEILYGVDPTHWGQGLATEAARAVLRYGFEEPGLDRIYAGADPPNTASFRVMEKAGLRFDKRTRVHHLEAIYYVISREAFRPADPVYVLRRA